GVAGRREFAVSRAAGREQRANPVVDFEWDDGRHEITATRSLHTQPFDRPTPTWPRKLSFIAPSWTLGSDSRSMNSCPRSRKTGQSSRALRRATVLGQAIDSSGRRGDVAIPRGPGDLPGDLPWGLLHFYSIVENRLQGSSLMKFWQDIRFGLRTLRHS